MQRRPWDANNGLRPGKNAFCFYKGDSDEMRGWKGKEEERRKTRLRVTDQEHTEESRCWPQGWA